MTKYKIKFSDAAGSEEIEAQSMLVLDPAHGTVKFYIDGGNIPGEDIKEAFFNHVRSAVPVEETTSGG